MDAKHTSDYKEISVEETFRLLKTSMNGLTEIEAESRIKKFGYNEVLEKKRSPIIDFLLRYWGPMPWLLELTMVLSFILQRYFEVIIIFILLTVNVIIGFFNRYNSQKAIELLKNKLAIKAKVLRDREWVIKDAREFVIGDIFTIRIGDLVPSDAKIIDGQVSIDQSVLTGESLPVNREASDILFSSSTVVQGEARCVVINTGKNTYFGRTTELVKLARPKSHQEELMLTIVKYSMYFSIIALVLVLIHATFINPDIILITELAIMFLMSSIPIALPAVFTILQAVGAKELTKRDALVRRLDSIEDAASMDVLCLDKTGTITQNKLSIIDVIPNAGYGKYDVALIAGLTCKEESKNVMDIAIIEYAKILGVNFRLYQYISFTSFDPLTKRAEAVVQDKERRFKAIKGAVQIVIPLCKGITEESYEILNKKIDELSQKGYRILAIAKSEDQDLNNLHFTGLISFADPVRPDSKDMIEEAKTLGIKPLMLTGDNINIAKEIARQTLIGPNIVQITFLKKLSEGEQVESIEHSDGFAEIYPEDKYQIVKLLQSRGHIVGMTGDGVNDAPALKQAEIGIALSNADDVAKTSASIVLIGQGLAVIIDAIKISRRIYQRVLTWVLNKITKTIQSIGILVVGYFWLQSIVISLLGIVLLVFANDFLTMSLATDNTKHTTNPNKWNVKNVTSVSVILGVLLIMEGVIAIFIGINYFHLGLEPLQTFILLWLLFTSIFKIFIVRERKWFWNSRPGRELIITTVVAIVGFTFLGIYGIIIPALTLNQVLFILGYSALFIFLLDPLKYYIFKKFGL